MRPEQLGASDVGASLPEARGRCSRRLRRSWASRGGVSGRCERGRVDRRDGVHRVGTRAGAGVGDRGGERFAVQVVCDIAALAEALGIDIDANVPVGLGSRAYLPRTRTPEQRRVVTGPL